MSREAPAPGPPQLATTNPPSSADGRHLLLWDGNCGFCRRIVEWVARHDTRHRLRPLPYQTAPASLVTEEVRRASVHALHVVTAEGRVLSAGRASLFVIGHIGWPLTARVLSWPPFIWAVELGYRLVAHNRGRLSRWFPGSTEGK
jgi:predicted DCC family thiol-disulfide oxidoreductase YuxK